MGKRKNTNNNTKSIKTKHPMEDTVKVEPRFAAAETRPHFRPIKTTDTKIVLDERFSSVLTDPRFQLQEKDKYGRKNNKNSKHKNKKKNKKQQSTAEEDLKAFYIVQNEKEKDVGDGSNEGNDSGEKKTEKERDNEDDRSSSRLSSSSADDDDYEGQNDPASRIAYLTALSRGELEMSSSSSSSDEDDLSQSSEEEIEQEGDDSIYGTAGVLDPSYKKEEEEEELVEISHDSSPYLVVTNMDWENIRAVDLFSVLSSFAPPGSIKKVQVYQSNFGMERMEKDKLYGPTGIWKKKKSMPKKEPPTSLDHDKDDDDEEREAEENMEESASHSESDTNEANEESGLKVEMEDIMEETDLDPEKLRAYEASKLKYFFAIVEFSKPEHADLVYQEVDGMEFERSSAAMDLRTIPAENVASVVKDRPMRDEATSIPGNYQPPEFVVSALQQTNVSCTWDQGDTERERKLTKYASSGWREEYEHDDLKAYLASDASSDEESDEDDEGDAKTKKAATMRKIFGLDSDHDDQNDDEDEDDRSSNFGGETSSDEQSASSYDKSMSKQIKYIPGQNDLQEKIRNKLSSSNMKEESKELTPWEKYQEKRKQKRRERRQAARGGKLKNGDDDSDGNDSHLGDNTNNRHNQKREDRDDFFMEDDASSPLGEATDVVADKSRQELELLLAGEQEEEEARDYDIRGIQRVEKNKGKKLKGSRKRKETKMAADVAGTQFHVNVHDNRFNAVLDGGDDRFGIDKTDPNFKDTSAMREILSEQAKRRKKKRKTNKQDDEEVVPPDVNNESCEKSKGASTLSSLVRRLKSRVA